MKALTSAMTAVAVTAVLGAGPVFAKNPSHVPCTKIRTAMAGGKSKEDVARELNVSTSRVEHCNRTHTKASTSHQTTGK
jgi:hypothetical protein